MAPAASNSPEKAMREPIAVIGMGCKFAGAESLEEYWSLLDAGLSMAAEPPPGRFPTKSHPRSTEKSTFFGNFLDDISNFDNKFFKKSGRESASMDPQQRLLLEVAYHTLENAGYFGPRSQDLDVGCFVGVCASDYNDNVASHPANAFSTLGTLRAFLTGKISHYFGFSGPSVTFDTACSSSAVAIDAACKAIRNGDCASALAGGVSIFTSPHFYQNLAAASFLSPTGATKSFDASADGYCRGEGVGLVMLKSLSQAQADGDHILGTVLSTLVQQSSNQVPITVPHSPSQTALYRRVLKMANVTADEVSVLEAHGTGTPIGDPQEFEGIKEVFGSKHRRDPMYFASVKGNIGHTEGASGVAALIKIVLMMQKGAIPRQASYNRLNPKIKLDPQQFHIPTETLPWTQDTKVACVNNYGAAGSIAALVVRETPNRHDIDRRGSVRPTPSRYPIIITGNSAASLERNCSELRRYLNSLRASAGTNVLGDVAFTLAERQNRSLSHIFTATASSIADLDDQLRIASANPAGPPCQSNADTPNPIILMFGGQTNRSIALDRDVYAGSALLKMHLDQCDNLLRGLGHTGIFPAIFSSDLIDDVVLLQTMQFSLHYACAQSWIACGLKVNCVVGHSFGQLVALTVAGVLSLEDGLKLVHGRAQLMQDQWGPEKGSMIALDADHGTAIEVIAAVKQQDVSSGLEISCYNGARSHVLVGSAKEVEQAAAILDNSVSAKYKVLNVTHGFHSRFCDPIVPQLEDLASSLDFQTPKIAIETASAQHTWATATPKLIADHMRTPVYFEDAIKRIEAKYGACTWIEAGSNSSVTSIARRCLSDTGSKSHSFFPINLSRKDALSALSDTASNLWKNGHHVQFWPFHHLQRQDYGILALPQYQFEKSRHWLELDSEFSHGGTTTPRSEVLALPEPDPVLLSFTGCEQIKGVHVGKFIVDPRSEEWKVLVSGHSVLEQPLCPAPLYVELVLQAAKELSAARGISSTPVATLEGLKVISSLGISTTRMFDLTLTQTDAAGLLWEFSFQARDSNAKSNDSEDVVVHAIGTLRMNLSEDSTHVAELNRVERLLQHSAFAEKASETGCEAVYGSVVYNVFSRVVQYHSFYKGIGKVTGKDGVIVADVSIPDEQPKEVLSQMLTNPVAVDNFLQVPGLYANCLAPCPVDEVFICTCIDRMLFAPEFIDSVPKTCWKVYATSVAMSEKEVHNDVFVTDNATNKIVFVAYGVKFNRVRISSLAKILARANNSNEPVQATKQQPPKETIAVEDFATPAQDPIARQHQPSTTGIQEELRQLLANVTDVPAEMFQEDISLADLGIDSLMATEVISVTSETFNVAIPQEDWADLLTFKAFSSYLMTKVAPDHVSKVQVSQPVHEAHQIESPQISTPPTPDSGDGDSQTLADVTISLAKLLATHLECNANVFQPSSNLSDSGLDSLLCIELMSDIEKVLGVKVDLTELTTESTFADLAQIVVGTVTPGLSVSNSTNPATSEPPTAPMTPVLNAKRGTCPGEDRNHKRSIGGLANSDEESDLSNAVQAFETTKADFPRLADRYQLSGFYENVMDKNSRLVLAYTVEAFAELGIDLCSLGTGEPIPLLKTLPKHDHLRAVLYEVLRDSEIADFDGKEYLRSEKPLDLSESSQLFNSIVREFPQHAKEHMLLNMCGAELAKLMSGAKDPLAVIFGSKANRDILEDVYSTGPMYVIMSQLLTSFLERTLRSATPGPDGKFRIMELGAGTGSTTKWVVDRLVKLGIPIEYTFTDISSSLVSAGKRKFSKYDCMKYATINIEKEPPAEYHGQFDIVLSTNCIHATSDLRNSLRNIDMLLQPQGFVSLVEFTTRMYWFDMVFGLLEGWWLFQDGRPYVLATPEFWKECMEHAGFRHVSWTGGTTRESEIVRVITGFKQPAPAPVGFDSIPQLRDGGMETVVYKHADKQLPLRADIYLPDSSLTKKHDSWTIGLSIHGGGHVMLSRRDVRPRQIRLMLENGVLPVSVDYRLCPETTLLDGPIPDVCDAYAWACKTLPLIRMNDAQGTPIRIEANKVAVIGWSTGGTLAMSLAWTAPSRGLPPPTAILVFYCPTDYEDEFWQRSNVPDHSESHSGETFNILDGVQEAPLTSYNVPRELVAAGGWMTIKDARSRLILHMNWRGQTLPVLFNGLPPARAVQNLSAYSQMEQPPIEQVRQASPYAQIQRGHYKSPTHIVFGTRDDLIPWQQAQRTTDAMRKAGLDCGLTLLDDAPHLFDLFRDPSGKRWEATLEGYRFLFSRIGKNVDDLES